MNDDRFDLSVELLPLIEKRIDQEIKEIDVKSILMDFLNVNNPSISTLLKNMFTERYDETIKEIVRKYLHENLERLVKQVVYEERKETDIEQILFNDLIFPSQQE